MYRRFAGNKYFSSLDLRHAYHHIEIRRADRHKTAFITNSGLYEWIRMSFGFCNAPSAFQRTINYIFRQLKFVIIYLDDILILSKSEEEHLEHLQSVFRILKEYDLKIRIDKCQFFKKELKYLGFILSTEGVRLILNMLIKFRLAPTDKKSLQRLIGKIGFIGTFQGYQTIYFH